jgi:non-canonical purine NTP pyrophosphatase (RdgB/HAM1 family)
VPEVLLIGTQNWHKVGELVDLLEGLPWNVQSLASFPECAAPDENSDAFEGNALLKARYYSDRYGVACVADDSGLVVDVLDGAPGVFSARYAGEGCSDADNNAKLLSALANVGEADRAARFVCCAAIAFPGGTAHIESGAVEGLIAFEGRGDAGFGYDPLFVPDGYSESFAELGAEVKQLISHRARAFGKMKTYLESRA